MCIVYMRLLGKLSATFRKTFSRPSAAPFRDLPRNLFATFRAAFLRPSQKANSPRSFPRVKRCNNHNIKNNNQNNHNNNNNSK